MFGHSVGIRYVTPKLVLEIIEMFYCQATAEVPICTS